MNFTKLFGEMNDAPKSTPSIALVCLPGEPSLPDWPWEKRLLPDSLFHAAAVVQALAEQTDAEYVLFWDHKLGNPDWETCSEILKKAGEIWHAGLLLGCAAQPEVLDYVYPVWMLQLDTAPDIASDSWRLSLRACLIPTRFIRQVGVFRSDFSDFDAAGLEWGYRLYRAGALLRHEPELVEMTSTAPDIRFNLRDALLFAALHFPRKWYWWVTFRLISNGSRWGETWRAIRFSLHKKQLDIQTIPRPAEQEKLHFKAEDWQDRVSVLMPTLQRYPYALNSIEQLLRQSIRLKEILITDQTDAAQRWENFAQAYPMVKVFPQEEKGQCVAWNKLLEVSTGDYVLFLGDDADGIRPEFLEEMCRCLSNYQADMVASNVLEIGGAADPYSARVLKLADGFPITLIEKNLVLRAGMMDLAFNTGIRADQDLAIRCRLLGAHMVFDSSIRILHHRAPVGGLRWHRQRVLTRHISKNDPFRIQYPAATEYLLYQKHFSQKQRREHGLMLLFSQMFVSGSVLDKALRILIFIFQFPRLLQRYSKLWR